MCISDYHLCLTRGYKSIEDNFKWVEIKGEGNLLSRRTGKWLAPGTNPYFRLYGAFIFRFTIENYFRRKPFRWLSIKGFEKLAKKDKNYRQRYLKLIQKQPFGWATSRKGKTPYWNRPTMELLEYLEIEKPKIIEKV